MSAPTWLYDRVRDWMSPEPRLAWLLWQLPDASRAVDPGPAATMAQEALSLLAAKNEPWVTIYVRRVQAQAVALRALDLGRGLPLIHAAVSAVRAGEGDDCPLAEGFTLDLCAAWALVDAEGTASERERLAQGALLDMSRRHPLRAEGEATLAAALLDQGRVEEALTRCPAPEEGDDHGLALRVNVLRASGRLTEALAAIPSAATSPWSAALRAGLLVSLGQRTAAVEALPPLEEVERLPAAWLATAQAVSDLVVAGALRLDHPTFNRLLGWSRRLRAQGAARPSLNLAYALADAVTAAPGAATLAGELLREASAATALLRDPEPARATIEARLDAARQAALRALPQDATQDDAPLTFDALCFAAARWPEEPKVQLSAAAAWRDYGFIRRAASTLRAAHGASPGSLPVAEALARALIETGALGELDGLLRVWAAREPDWAQLALKAESTAREAQPQRGDPREPLRHLLSRWPGDGLVWRHLAALERDAGDFAAAIQALDVAAARLPPAEVDWERLWVGSVVGAWASVRAAAARLGLPVTPGEGPIVEDWGAVELHIGEGEVVLGRRTGPATAVVTTLSPPGAPQRYADEVVLHPDLLSAPEAHTPRFMVKVTLLEGGFACYSLRGPRPAPDVLDLIESRLRGEGVVVRPIVAALARDPWSGDEHPVYSALLGLPPEVTTSSVAGLIEQLTAQSGAPLFAPELLEDGGLSELAAEHAEQAARWGLGAAGR